MNLGDLLFPKGKYMVEMFGVPYVLYLVVSIQPNDEKINLLSIDGRVYTFNSKNAMMLLEHV